MGQNALYPVPDEEVVQLVNEILQRCPGCMQPLTGAAQCPMCGTPAVFEQAAPFLPLRALLLQGRIGVGRAMEQNGDGITYLAFDSLSGKPVCLREFFPASIAMRAPGQLTPLLMQGCEAVWQDCCQNFLELWRKLQRLRGLTALISVTEVFEENGTVYAVYEHVESMTYRDFLLRGKLGYISWDRARALLMPVLSTLGHLHQQGILHRGISPGTLLFCADGKVRLSGFSIWQARTAHGDLTAELAEGYAALEQYGVEDMQGPWTDIYAFAAVLYRSLIGSDPDGAVVRRHNDRLMVPAQFAERIPAYVINALINAMQVFPEERTRTVEYLRAELSASPAAIVQSASFQQPAPPGPMGPPAQEEKPIPPAKRQSAGAVAAKTAAIIIAVGLVACGILAFLLYGDPIRERISGWMGTGTTEPATTTVQTITVPQLEGRVFDDALLLEFENKLDLREVRQHHDTVEAGRIIKQDRAAGSEVPLNFTIVLTVSQGPEMIALPEDIEGRPFAEVREELEALGFKVTISATANDGSQQAGTVRSVNLTPGESYPKGMQIFMAVWGNPDGTPLEPGPAEEPAEPGA